VLAGDAAALWVHNADSNDPKLDEPLLWGLGAQGPRQRPYPKDLDGASAWETTSKAEVQRFMGIRAREGKIGNHGAITKAELQEMGLIAVPTPMAHALAIEAGLKHYSIRPIANPDPEMPLTETQVAHLQKQLEATPVYVKAKPKDVGCG
jgi:hypothetical protein